MINNLNKYRFENASAEEVIDYLKSRETQFIETTADALKLINEGEVVSIFDRTTKKTYFASELLIEKLLYWNANFTWQTQNYGQLNFFPLEIKVEICNYNLSQMGNKELILRIENGTAFVINSSDFTFFSDLDAIELAKPYGIMSVSRDEKIMRINTQIQSDYAPVENDVSGFGFTIINSETGYAALDIRLFVYRYWCSNGATSVAHDTSKKIKHYKISVEKLLSSVQEMLISSEVYRKLYEQRLKESLEISASGFFSEIIREIKYLLGNEKEVAFFKDFPIRWNTTKYDLYNFITDKAKQYGVFDRYKLEAFAGNLIMNKSGKKIDANNNDTYTVINTQPADYESLHYNENSNNNDLHTEFPDFLLSDEQNGEIDF